MDQAEFDRLLKNVKPVPAEAAKPALELDQEALAGAAEALGLSTEEGAEVPAEELRPDGTSFSEPPAEEPGLGDPSGLDAVAGGALKSVFETKDFLFGDTPEESRSAFRENVEETTELRGEQSIVDGFMAEVSQFATAMVGLGKAKKVAEALPWFGAGLAGLTSTKKAKVAAEVGQAALAGAIAFDPHEERLSNLIQSTPLANPLNAWLAADPEDSAAEGRMKAALESIGMDAALLGTFMAGGRIWKYLRKGEVDKAAREADALEKEAQDAVQADETPEEIADDLGRDDVQAGAVPSAGPSGMDAGDLADSGTTGGQSVDGTPSPEGLDGPPRDTGDSPDRGDGEASPQGDETVGVEVVSSPTEAKANAGAETRNPSPKPRIQFNDENTEEVLKGLEADAEAIAKHGGWYEAIEAGHVFGKGDGIPYRKLNTDADVDDFMARVVDAAEERLDNLKGGAILTDKRVDNLVKQRAKLFDDDPALLLGMIQKAGRDASTLVANMEAGYLVANRLFQDAYALGVRINMGDLVEFGGNKLAAQEELRKRLSLAASIYGASKSMSSNAGRSLRRMRADFKIDPKDVEALGRMDADALTELLASTKGDPRAIAKLANPSTWTKVTDFMSFLYINNLVSGPMTQIINATTNAYMLGVRPLERIIGSVVMDAVKGTDSRSILRESTKQYTYMRHAFTEGFSKAAQAFLKADSILTPHQSEVYKGVQAGEGAGVPTRFKPWNSVPNMIYNAYAALPVAVGVPTRTLGFVDELMKQTTYRSKVMAGAYWEAVEKGQKGGYTGKQLEDFVNQYVTDKLDMAFDSEGRGVNAKALHEAQLATFQQDLLPGTLGKWFQTGVVNHPAMRLVLPFVKTPTNVIRYGWKMTPGLNLLQTEYRQMITGKMGEEAQRQAVGQMTMGGLFLGAASFVAADGALTGAGPSSPQLRSELMATGWRPYSFVKRNGDGSKTYVPYGRFDPIAIPFGIIADLQDVLTASPEKSEETEFDAAVNALLLAIGSQISNQTFLMGISQGLDALMDPERSGFFKQTAANFIPYSAALRNLNPDPHLREARDLTDKLMATIPGLSEKVPARYDAFGDPVTVRGGLWSYDDGDPVDLEVQRLALENGSTITKPTPYQNGVDLRDLVLSDGRNAYAAYQEYAGHLPGSSVSLKDAVKKVMESDAYKRAPDGDVATRGTKLWLLHRPVSRYREMAMKLLKRDPVVREAFMEKQLKVRDHYADRTAAPKQEPSAGLGEVGEAFGVDLDALLGPLQRD